MYGITQRATQGSPLIGASSDYIQKQIAGDFDNPYLADAIRLAQSEQIPGLGYMANASGSFGNSGINQAAVQNMGNIATDMRFNAYNADRQRQMEAAQYAPTLANQDYQDMQMLMGVGDARRAYQQQIYDAQRGEWEAANQWPYTQLDWLTNQIRGVGYGSGAGTTTTTGPNPYQQSGFANLIGGGALAGSLFDVLSK
jgi:hypothetical protein